MSFEHLDIVDKLWLDTSVGYEWSKLRQLLSIKDKIAYVTALDNTNKKDKTTTINAASEVKISDETFTVIAKKVEAIRKKIIL